jgi:hypothetical protein
MPGESPSIRDSIRGAIDSAASTASAASSPPPSDVSTPAPVQSDAPPAPVSTLKSPSIPATTDAGSPLKDRARTPDGKFQAKGPTDPASPVSADAQPKTPDPALKKEDGGDMPPILPPSTWGKDAKVEWSTLPRSAQAEIERREKDRDRALHQERSRIQNVMRRYEALDRVIGPRQQAFAAQGLDEARAVAQLFALSDSANADPAGFVQWFAKQRGLDLASLVAGNQSQAPEDPRYQALTSELSSVKKAMMELGRTHQNTVQSREQAEQSAMVQTIERFAQETDEKGAPKRPYFDRLEPYIMAQLSVLREEMPAASPTEKLEAAYERAVYANPETRQAVTAQAEARRRAEEQAKAAKAAEAARVAGAGITGGTAPSGSSVPPKSIREGLVRAMEAQKSRAA